jgi:hypothetical protein
MKIQIFNLFIALVFFALPTRSSTAFAQALTAQLKNGNVILTWTNSAYVLQSSPTIAGPFTNVPSATSPYTNTFTGMQRFFRVVGVTFTVTPCVISNTYTGTITLQISGIPPGDTVVVQRFLDADANTVLDSSNLLIQQFNLTDGQSGMVIGGVANINVPYDTDGMTNGQITAQLNFPDVGIVPDTVGKYFFVVSSPAGDFAPMTNSFAITNFPFSQMITGDVVSGTNSVPDAIIMLFPSPNQAGTPIAETLANNSGAFSIPAPPGTYIPMAIQTNYIANYSTSPVVTLGSGQTISTNLALDPATASISGNVVNAIDSSIKLPGLFLSASGADNQGDQLIAIGFTDTNGNFAMGVGSGSWNIAQSEDGSLAVLGYVGSQPGTNVNAGTTNVILTRYKATALFYGTIKDTFGNPLPGVSVQPIDSNSVYSSDSFSTANGSYVATALGGFSGDPWTVAYDYGGPASYIYSQPTFNENGGTNLGMGQAIQVNFTGILATNFITGEVQDGSGNPIAGVGVNVSATINGSYFEAYVDTDADGNYSFNVCNGNWDASLNCTNGGDSLQNILGSSGYDNCPGDQEVDINNNNGTANFSVQSQLQSGVSTTVSEPIYITVPAGQSKLTVTVTDVQDQSLPSVTTNVDLGDIILWVNPGSLPSGCGGWQYASGYPSWHLTFSNPPAGNYYIGMSSHTLVTFCEDPLGGGVQIVPIQWTVTATITPK